MQQCNPKHFCLHRQDLPLHRSSPMRATQHAQYVAQFPVKASIAIRSARKCVSLDVSKYTYQSQGIDRAKSIVTKAVTTKSTVRL